MIGRIRPPLRRLLRRAGLLNAARAIRLRIALLTDQAARRREGQRARDYARFAREYGRALEPVMPGPRRSRRALIVSGGTQGVEVELALTKALEVDGYDSVALVGGDHWPARYHALAGARAVNWDDFDDILPSRAVYREAARVIERMGSLESLLDYEERGARVGRSTAATALRALRVGALDFSRAEHREQITEHLARAMSAARASDAILDRVRPDLGMFVDRGYTPQGELFDIAIGRAVDSITWNAGHRNNTVVFKRYARANRDQHFLSLSDASWDMVRRMDWGAAKRDALVRELHDTYSSGEWYSEVGTQFNTRIVDREALREQLGLDPSKPTAVIFPHILWDGTFFWGTDLFGSYEEWLVETVRAASENLAVNWVLKIHPAHLVKNARDGVHGEPAELVALNAHFGGVPAGMAVLPPSSDVSTYSLYGMIDHCVTVRGTVGIEAAALGVTVLTAGTGRYDRRGFTVDPGSREEYLDMLRHLENLPPPSADARELAERFAYATFVMRPLLLETVTYEFGRDAAATPRSHVNARGPEDWVQAADLRAFREWIADRSNEDFFGKPPVNPAAAPGSARSSV